MPKPKYIDAGLLDKAICDIAKRNKSLILTVNQVYHVICDQPSADVKKVKHATWIKYPCVYVCSNCNHMDDNKSPYCCICGAKMDLKESEE
jgi:hypothetical protein